VVASAVVLQRCLHDAIAALRPAGTMVPVDAGRAHQVLTLRYVQGLEAVAVQERLGISQSTYYREHQRGLGALTNLLHEQWRVAEVEQGGTLPCSAHADGHEGTSKREVPHNLPLQLTSFVGRERDLDELRQTLASARLLTLTGTGGCGKTRLALHMAADMLDSFPDGVWLVELAPLADPALVPHTIAAALGVRETPGQPILDTLLGALRPKRLLVLLDNCEHLLDACAQIADALLRRCPGIRILATSREALGIAGEVSRRVPSLSVPQEEGVLGAQLTRWEAVQLFVERAQAVRADFALTEQNAPDVAQVCRRLDGIPLALELAAARLQGLTVAQLAARLDQRFRLLTTGSRTALPRQQTLRATIDWSYDLLGEPERRLFGRLSVFAGGWTLEAAEAVCQGPGIGQEEVLDLLLRLVDKSLVIAEEGRYWLLETVRQYGRDRLATTGDAQALYAKHAACYLWLAEELEPQLLGPGQAISYDRLDVEHDNLRAALAWGLGEAGEPEAALRLAGALSWFWFVGGYFTEGRSWLERALAAGAAAPASVRSKALKGAGDFAGDQEQAEARYAEGLALCRSTHDWRGIATALADLGRVAMERPDYAVARVRFEESLVVGKELADQWRVADALCWLGNVRREQGEYAAARSALEESLAVFRALGNRSGIARALTLLGQIAAHEGDGDAARARLQEAVGLFREARDLPGMGWSLGLLGSVDTRMGDYQSAVRHVEESTAVLRELGGSGMWYFARSLLYLGMAARGREEHALARSLYRESLAVSRGWGYRHHIVEVLERCAGLAAADGQPGRAARLFGAAEALRTAFGAPVPPADRAEHERDGAAARAALGDQPFAAAWAAGQAMTLEQAVECALAETTDA
jgi:non-specific serine/threonine protein kinase